MTDETGTHSEVGTDSRDAAFLLAAGIAVDLVRRPEVAQRWQQPSALPRMAVGALACHLGRQVVHARNLLRQPTTEKPLGSAADHYRRAAWVTATSLDDPANDRTPDEREAAAGFDALSGTVRTALQDVRGMLDVGRAEPVVLIPWQGWALRRGDFLLTRMLEIVVHGDDLAVSVGVPTPEFPGEVLAPVLELLAGLAANRHGQPAVIRAFARAERAPSSIAAF
jgi:hypothetical protein